MENWRYSNFYFFYFTSIGILIPYWSLYLDYLGFTATEIGQLVAIFVLTKVVAPNIWATLADVIAHRTGRSLFILRFATGASLLTFCLLFAVSPEQGIAGINQFWRVALITLGYSVFWNACMPQMEAATLSHLAGQRYKYGNIRLWGSVGFIVTVLGLGYLLDYYDPSIIITAGALSFLAMFIASFYLRDTSPKKNKDTGVHKLGQLLNRKVLIVLALCTLMQISHAPFYTFFSLYLQSYGYSAAYIGALWTIGVLFEIVVFMLGYRILRQYRLTNLLTFTFFVAAIRWLILAYWPEQLSVVLFSQVLHAITYGLHHSVIIQLIDQIFQGRFQVRGQALYSSITFGIGGAFGSVISGVIWSYYGASMLFVCAGLLMLIATIIAVLFINPKEEQIPIREL